MSKCRKRNTYTLTYRRQEDQCSLEFTQVLDLLLSDANGHVFDKWVELLQGGFTQDGHNNVFVDLLASVLAEAFTFSHSRCNSGECVAIWGR